MPMQKSSQQWTDEQRAWLRARAERLGLRSMGDVARMIVQAEMDREAGQPVLCPTCGQEWRR